MSDETRMDPFAERATKLRASVDAVGKQLDDGEHTAAVLPAEPAIQAALRLARRQRASWRAAFALPIQRVGELEAARRRLTFLPGITWRDRRALATRLALAGLWLWSVRRGAAWLALAIAVAVFLALEGDVALDVGRRLLDRLLGGASF